jgi:hypothetical protein
MFCNSKQKRWIKSFCLAGTGTVVTRYMVWKSLSSVRKVHFKGENHDDKALESGVGREHEERLKKEMNIPVFHG